MKEEEDKSDGRLAIPKFRQKSGWDCGIACCKMALDWAGVQVSWEEICARVGTKSVWTIDLLHLLHHYGLKFSFYTTTVGIDPKLASSSFYKDDWDEDEKRVGELFKKAELLHFPIYDQVLRFEEITTHLENGGLAIILIDARYLYCHGCCYPVAVTTLASAVLGCVTTLLTFAGHFILLVGFDKSEGLFLVKDPSKSNGKAFLYRIFRLTSADYCKVKKSVLESAWLSYGTDQDIILLDRRAL